MVTRSRAHTAVSTTRTRLGVAALAVILSATACGDTGSSGPPPAAAPTTAVSDPAGAPNLDAGEELAHGLNVPWGLAFLPDGSALVAERDTGAILRLVPGSAPERVYEVPGVVARGEGGLLGLAISPRYAEDRYVYAYFTGASDNRIVRFRLDGPAQDIFTGIAKAGNHNGGRIAFGPDGMLYVGTGDAQSGPRSQDRTSPNGKILRLTPDGRPAPGNPDPDSPVYSLGLRNVQGLAWDREGRLYASEFGQNALDEINLIEPGRNYGWPAVEGVGDTEAGRYTNPLVTWRTRDSSPSGIAITANTVYVAALRGERLWSVPLRDGGLGDPEQHLRDRYGRLRTVEVAPDGALWLTTSNTDGRGDIRRGDDRIIRFPAR
ncbi:PQQ-dependent sugar dehydrogenase [Nocardia transvalensis]|uniref:PQQ-dependent sugar dehydrogenase n=1 Tax=Nocardia transvalensis TaxID=37333 RepID=UPI001895F44A|nr:PQQ-dependent sugar dehydrogenase [Nocardia transvalensis]MBF6329518.1 PQQ-dependent sugar dehydrogenase [Nocardia transvalensis]